MVLFTAGLAALLAVPAAAQLTSGANAPCANCHETPPAAKGSLFLDGKPEDTAALRAWLEANPDPVPQKPAYANPFSNRCSTINCHQPPSNGAMGLHEPAFNFGSIPCRTNCHTANGDPARPSSLLKPTQADADAIRAWIQAGTPSDQPAPKKDDPAPVTTPDPKPKPKPQPQPVIAAPKPVPPDAPPPTSAKDQLDEAADDPGTGEVFDGSTPVEKPAGNGAAPERPATKPSPVGQKYPKPAAPAVESKTPVPAPEASTGSEAVSKSAAGLSRTGQAILLSGSLGVTGAVVGAMVGGPLGAVLGGLAGAALGALLGGFW